MGLGWDDGLAAWLSTEPDIVKRTNMMREALLECQSNDEYSYTIGEDWGAVEGDHDEFGEWVKGDDGKLTREVKEQDMPLS